MDIFNSLNQSFFETCEKIDKLWQKKEKNHRYQDGGPIPYENNHWQEQTWIRLHY